uniref:Photosystem II protein J n=2 Tax=Selaginella TaxID=3246 RepID=A0A482A7V1_SELUN|nr:photosystem II protein J [Selaginella uncinata]YP_009589526.1 photosystem II protein J [Selaginella hainanensis]QBL07881.1 photosystem II protein J [Selaginella uncinata]QBL76107.1 photosystem II protein J [Selaginella hainanensis]
MANTTGRTPPWLVGTTVGTLVIGSVGISFHGPHPGSGSSL